MLDRSSAALCYGLLLALVALACGGEGEPPPRGARPSEPMVFDIASLEDDPPFRVREWGLDDGLPTPVRAVAQSPDGYLWVTTAEGLARFDGVRFEVFTPETTPIFRSGNLQGAYVSEGGDLWVGSRDRWVYRLRDGEWTAYSVEAELDGQHWVQTFAEDGDGVLWMASTGPNLLRFDGQQWIRYPQPLAEVWPLLAVDDEGTLWVTVDPSEAPGAPETLAGPERGVVARMVNGRFVPPANWRAIGFSPNGGRPLFFRPTGETDGDRQRIEMTDAQGQVLAWGWDDGQPRWVMLVDRAGRIWAHVEDAEGQSRMLVGRDGGVLAEIAPEGATWFEQVVEDRQGNVWTFAESTGLLQITADPFQRLSTGDGVPRFAVRVGPSSDGGVLVSTGSGGAEARVATIRDGGVSSEVYRLTRDLPLLSDRITGGCLEVGHAVEDGRGRRWGLAKSYLFRLEAGEATPAFTTGRDGSLWTLYPDPGDPDALWTGDVDGGVWRYDAKLGTATDSFRVGTEEGGFVHTIRRTEDDRLWIGHAGGLSVREPGGEIQPFAAPALRGVTIRAIAEGPQGGLWFATEGSGLVRLFEGEVQVLSTAEGLPVPHVSGVMFDEHGFIWVTGRQMLYRLSFTDALAVLGGERETLDAVTLLPSDGHLGSSPRLASTHQSPDGALWVPSFRGVTWIDPTLYAQQHARPVPVVVESIATESDETFPPSEGLRLPVDERQVTVRYTAPDLLAPDQVRFRTFLDGHDTEWHDRGGVRTATVGGLRPGRYTFHVQAMNAGGVWSHAVVTPTFVVPRRFYETWAFALACLLALGGLAVVGYRARVRALSERQRRLEALVEERTADLQAEKDIVAAQAAELLTLDEAKNRFFANVSHEFRTPLQLILGPLAELAEGTFGDLSHPAREQVDVAERNAWRLLALVEQLLTLARADAGHLKPEPRRLDAAAFGARVAELFQPLAEREGVSLEMALPATDATFDPGLMETVLANLLANAIAFTPEGGTVTLALTPGPPLAFSVHDTGPGLAPHEAARVFDRFYQADASATRRHRGTGIGLALVREIAEAHGGTALAESPPGEGARFTITLPGQVASSASDPKPPGPVLLAAASGDGQRRAASAPPAAPPDVPRVLVADDNADLRDLVRRHLDDRYSIAEAGDGEDALALARDLLPDVVVSDVMMPGLDGFELVRALRDSPETDFLPVLLLTARASIADTVEGLGAGADDYLAKPFAPAELRARVDALIASRQRLRERWGGTPAPLPAYARPEATPTQRTLVEQLVAFVDANLDDDALAVDALAEAVGMSRSTLYRRLEGALEGSPADLLRSVRLDRAAGLLQKQAGSVTEVAYAVGFRSVSHFSARFRDRFGATPSEFTRERAKNGKNG
ncbi:MAG: response regulator [Bacteroidota bacterium]